jgi:hypothetical protein
MGILTPGRTWRSGEVNAGVGNVIVSSGSLLPSYSGGTITPGKLIAPRGILIQEITSISRHRGTGTAGRVIVRQRGSLEGKGDATIVSKSSSKV